MTFEDQTVVEISDLLIEFELKEYKSHTLKEYILDKLHRRNKGKALKAVNNVNLTLKKGESLAIIGHNGSGKSTLLKAIAGIIKPRKGSIHTKGRIAPMIELGAGFDGELSGKENIKLSCLLMGLSIKEIEEKMDEIIKFSELEKFIHMPVKNYSSGMYARLGFACTTAVNPELLIVDEILAVGDTNFAKKCLHRISQLRSEGVSVIMVSHDHNSIRQFCDRAIVMNEGKLVYTGSVDQAIREQDEIMFQRELDQLPPAEKEDILRQRDLRENYKRRVHGESKDKLPIASMEIKLVQHGKDVSKLDFATPFDIEVGLVLKDRENFQGDAFFGFELQSQKNETRIGGLGTEPNVLIPREQIVANEHFTVVFPFPKGVRYLCKGSYNMVFAIHDNNMTRHVFMDKREFDAVNKDHKDCFNNDIVKLSSFGAAPNYRVGI